MPNFASIIDPLLSINTARLKIRFTALELWQIAGKEALVRGGIGFHLKKTCCPFPDFSKKPCDGCTLTDNCLYLTLFSPIVKSEAVTAKSGAPVRPFVFAVIGIAGRHVLHPGETGALELTLFGPAIRYCSLFLEAGMAALGKFPVTVKEILPIEPKGGVPENIAENGEHVIIAWPLSDWTKNLPVPDHEALTLSFLTPIRLVSKGSLRRKDMTFSLFVTNIIRRLRNLKRAFGEDDDMGTADESFYSTTESVTILDDRLDWGKKKRFSHSQKKDVHLSGLRGEIVFGGDFHPFFPLIRAGELVHIGKGSSSGNGKYGVVD